MSRPAPAAAGSPPTSRGRTHRTRWTRWTWWGAVVVAVVAVVAGTAWAAARRPAGHGPDEVVRSYLAALAAGDAAGALGLGRIPAGDRHWLTAPVLARQLAVAVPGSVDVLATDVSGDRAVVRCSYRLDPGPAAPPGSTPRAVTARVSLHRRQGRWQLDRVAVPVQLQLSRAAQRASLAGARLPTDTVLLFPGAIPLQFDTRRLAPAPDQQVAFGAPAAAVPVALQVQATPAARRALLRTVDARLEACARGSAPADSCPVPGRVVPGSLDGGVLPGTEQLLTVSVATSPRGVLRVDGTVLFTGSYQRLDFQNVVHDVRGQLPLPVHARSYAVGPLAVTVAGAAR